MQIKLIPLDTHIIENIVNCRACVYLSYSIRNIRLEWEARRYMDCSLMVHGYGKSIWIRLWTSFSIIRWTKLQKVLSVCLTIIADLSTQTSSAETQRHEWLQMRSTNRLIILETRTICRYWHICSDLMPRRDFIFILKWERKKMLLCGSIVVRLMRRM